MRGINEVERDNISWLRDNEIPFGLIEVTETGLSKSILDATEDFRQFLIQVKAHDFATQAQGTDSKKTFDSLVWVTEVENISSRMSAYRPNTKGGDPRIWISNLRHVCNPGDIFVTTWFGEKMHTWNLRSINVRVITSEQTNAPLSQILNKLAAPKLSAREELTALLMELGKKGWVRGVKSGTTAVGHLLETELGIKQNSSPTPDFKGIELKSTATKSKRSDRFTLFAKVPTWNESHLKSSAEILNRFGYVRDSDFKLYCTVRFGVPNSQGLYFDYGKGYLEEVCDDFKNHDVVKWNEKLLLQSLSEKHKETFWVKAKTESRNDGVYFKFEAATNTKNPVLEQFVPLIQAGEITMDHLIKRSANGTTSEKGPLFKIRSTSLDLLFPKPEQITLIAK